MNPFGIFVCILWGTVALFSVLSFVMVVHNNRRNLKRAQAVVIEKNTAPSGLTHTARASDVKTDYIIRPASCQAGKLFVFVCICRDLRYS